MNTESITPEIEREALDCITRYLDAKKCARIARAKDYSIRTGKPSFMACSLDELPPQIRTKGALAMFKFVAVTSGRFCTEQEFEHIPFAEIVSRIARASQALEDRTNAGVEKLLDGQTRIMGKLDSLTDWLADWRENGPKIDADNPPRGIISSTVRDVILKCWTGYQANPDKYAPDAIQRKKGQKPSLEECLKYRENHVVHNGQTLGQLLDDARIQKTEHTRLATFKRLVASAQKWQNRQSK